MKNTLLAGAGAAALGFVGMVSPVQAGNILLTGHDNDFHCNAGNAGNACGALGVELAFVRSGSSLPVLVIDNGSELSSSLTTLGIPQVDKTVAQVNASTFSAATYSAFAVASVTSCGGCDNPTGTGTTLSAFSAAIVSFFNAGRGILGLAGASDAAAYAYVPDSAGVTTPISSSSGFVATSTGTTGVSGFFAVNGDQTHNTFSNPGTGGVSSAYKVAERFGGTASANPAVTLFATATIKCVGSGCTIVSHGVPEPLSLSLLGVGVFGLAVARRTRRFAKLQA